MNHLECALKGPNQWWRYFFVILIVFFGAQVLGGIPLGIVLILASISNHVALNTGNSMDFIGLGIDLNLGLSLMLFSFIVGLFLFILIIKPFHKRNYKEVINGTNKIRWNKFFYAAGVWTSISALLLLSDYFINPTNFYFNIDWSAFVPLVFIVIIMIPFQSTFEEIIFRGYLAQGVARWTRSRWLSFVFPAILFGLMHAFNPEIAIHGFWIMMPQYIFFGLVLGLISILDDGIELAMGLHAANNMFLAIFVTTKSSVLQTSALLVQDTVYPVKELFVLMFASFILIFILAKKYKWNFAILNQRVESKIVE